MIYLSVARKLLKKITNTHTHARSNMPLIVMQPDTEKNQKALTFWQNKKKTYKSNLTVPIERERERELPSQISR